MKDSALVQGPNSGARGPVCLGLTAAQLITRGLRLGPFGPRPNRPDLVELGTEGVESKDAELRRK
jgi:hypothetical protein